MRLTDEQVMQDNKRFANCNALAELKYCGWDIPHRKSITNDEIHFYAWLCRSAVAMLKEQETMMKCIKGKCRICPHCVNCDVDDNGLLKEQEHEVCENCPYKLEDIGDFSDGYHTFNDLYTQRAVLFATIVNQNLDKAWKSLRHEDGKQCFGGGWFIVGVDTPKGSYTYHYEEKYWSIFQCVELPVAKHWDGHTDKDVWRLLTLT